MSTTGERAVRRLHRTRRGALATAALTAVVLTACSGSSEGDDDPLATARTTLEETSGVDLAVSTPTVPKGSDGFLRLVGTVTDAPAFDGDVRVRVNDITEDLPMVVVDGAVYAQLPFTEGVHAEVDPADYGAPDGAEMLDPEHGLPGWLAGTTEVTADDGTVTGTIPGDVVARLIASADPKGTFDAEYRLDGDDRLERAVVTGPFYRGAGDVTYTVDVAQYDVSQEITRPEVRDR